MASYHHYYYWIDHFALLKKREKTTTTTDNKIMFLWVSQLAQQLKMSLRKKKKNIFVHTWRCPTWCGHRKRGTHSYTTCCGCSTSSCNLWGIFFHKIHDPKQSHEIEQRILNLQIQYKFFPQNLLVLSPQTRFLCENQNRTANKTVYFYEKKKTQCQYQHSFLWKKKSNFVDSGFVVWCHYISINSSIGLGQLNASLMYWINWAA